MQSGLIPEEFLHGANTYAFVDDLMNAIFMASKVGLLKGEATLENGIKLHEVSFAEYATGSIT
jgi:hypothetical protein